MLEPKNTLVGLAGQNAWHIWTGEALLRIIGKYRPSQLRTQNEGPELATTVRGGEGAGCGSVAIGSAKKLACGTFWRCCFCAPPKKKSNRFPALAMRGASATASAATVNNAQHRMRELQNPLRNAYSTRRNRPGRGKSMPQLRIHLTGGW